MQWKAIRQFTRLLVLLAVCIGVSTTSEASHTKSTTTRASKYDVAIPVLFGVTLTDITSDFGDPRGGGTRKHEGQDIVAPKGTPIVSPVKGTVLKYGTAVSPGKYVYVKGSDGHTYAFMHLDEIAKLRRNQKIAVGDLIGTVGDTGNAKGTTPHLHFEIRKGKPLDPYTRIKKEFTFEEKIKYLNEALRDLKNDDELVDHIVERYRGLLMLAQAEDITLDRRFTAALEKSKSAVSLASTTVGLQKGSSGEQVKALQNALIALNMGPVAYRLAQAGATGYFGSITHDALIEFQTVHRLTPDGIFGPLTKTALMQGTSGEVKGVSTSTPVLPSVNTSHIATVITTDIGPGAQGLEVSLIQSFLMHANAGIAAQSLIAEGATGYFGIITESALREYQIVNDISPTGVYDLSTRAHLQARKVTVL